MSETITNRVATSSLKTIDLEEYYVPGERVMLDVSNQLFQGQILREKDFREFIKAHDWSSYQGKHVAIYCSADAIIPTWAYMLLASALAGIAATMIYGSAEELETVLFKSQIESIDWSEFKDSKVVIKGCSKVHVPVGIYVEVTVRLRPFVSSIMYGEPCSTVPVFKAPKV